MTVSTTLRKAGPFTGNGVTTVFPFAFKVFATTDVVATAATAGVEATLVLGVDYTVALNADQDGNPGGSITTTVPLAVGRVLVLTSNVPQTQNTLVTNNGGFFAAVFNAVFDRAVILIQQLTEVVSRSVTIPKTAIGVTSLQVPVAASAVLQWSADGSQLTAVTLPTLALQLALPSMAGKGGQFLTNDGVATATWGSSLPAQAGKADYALFSDGATAGWGRLRVINTAGNGALYLVNTAGAIMGGMFATTLGVLGLTRSDGALRFQVDGSGVATVTTDGNASDTLVKTATFTAAQAFALNAAVIF